MNWAVHIMGVVPQRATMPETEESLRAAGWHGFVEWVDKIATETRRAQGERLWETFRAMLAFEGNRDADWMILLQDDIQLTSGLRAWLEWEMESFARKRVLLSLYTPGHLMRSGSGWYELSDAEYRGSWGACGYAVSPAVAGELASYQPEKPEIGIDTRVVQACRDLGIQYLFHRPSLCQHRGAESLLHSGSPLDTTRSADWFAESAADLLTLNRKRNPCR